MRGLCQSVCVADDFKLAKQYMFVKLGRKLGFLEYDNQSTKQDNK